MLRSLTPGTISVIVTSPPYNLGVRYRSYDDTLPRDRYLDWTGAWIKAAAKALDPAGSLFLNVGAKPTGPWTALDVAPAARGPARLSPIADPSRRSHGEPGETKELAQTFASVSASSAPPRGIVRSTYLNV